MRGEGLSQAFEGALGGAGIERPEHLVERHVDESGRLERANHGTGVGQRVFDRR